MKCRRKLAAVVAAAALGLVGVFAIGASGTISTTGESPTVAVTFATFQTGGHWVARAILWTPVPPPPATGAYTRVFQATGKTRTAAVNILVEKMVGQLKPALVVKVLGQTIGEKDLG